VRAHEPDLVDTPPTSMVEVASLVGTLAGVVVLIGLLLTLDLFLARIDLRESARHAASEYAQGLALLAAAQPARAGDHFAAALAIERDNVNYALALGEAQRRAGHADEAEITLRALLERVQNDGAVNLALARVLAGQGRVAEAKPFFHRAIYGRWGADSVARRADARFALIELLAKQGGGRDLLAELLPLEDVPADSIALRKRLGRWFLLGGSPVRAANMFREVLRRHPDDGEAFAGMGEAALAQGNFRTARADFGRAVELLPPDTLMARRLALADTLIALDPMARGLDAPERVARGRALLARMLGILDSCVSETPRPAAIAASAFIGDTIQAGSTPAAQVDSVMTLAGQLWSTYARCPSTAGDSVVRRLALHFGQ
jgi:tetratricopeptide (TPR) repeat protein